MTGSKISVGTVKLGVADYGFSSGRQDNFDSQKFLQDCYELGISHLDTSPRYGNSESVIGEFMRSQPEAFKVNSKVDNLVPGDKANSLKVVESIKSSLAKLNVEQLDVCYLHQNDLDIISDSGVQAGLDEAKSKGLIKKAGVSVYSFDECAYACESEVYEVIQLPISVFDLGFYKTFVENKISKKSFVARSVLLQGILVNRAEIKNRVKQHLEVEKYLRNLDEMATARQMTTLEMCMRFTLNLSGIDHFIIGTTNVKNLNNILKYSQNGLDKETIQQIYEMGIQEKVWTNPRNW